MCGIVAYLGNKAAEPIVINGLKRLEYRGYDSTGIAYFDDQSLHTHKTKGKVSDLEEVLAQHPKHHATVAMGHTRWATHVFPTMSMRIHKRPIRGIWLLSTTALLRTMPR